MRVVTVEQMRALEAAAFAAGTTPEILMGEAGNNAAEVIAGFCRSQLPGALRRVVVLCGKGNNGGDGYVVAGRLMELLPLPVTVITPFAASELTATARHYADNLPSSVEVLQQERLSSGDLRRGDLIVDALLGTGVAGAVRPPFENYIEVVNRAGLPVVALDTPSGLNCDTGICENCCIQATMTVMIGHPKIGQLLRRGPQQCGLLRLAPLTLPADGTAVDGAPQMVFAAEIAGQLKPLPVDAHKNTRARVLVLGGSGEYYGAPVLSAVAALRSGAGLVRLGLPELSGGLTPLPAALIVRRLPAGGKADFNAASVASMLELARLSSVIAVGPGLGNAAGMKDFLAAVLALPLPVVLDADALNQLAQSPELWDSRPAGAVRVLTPHPGEMRRLLQGLRLAVPEDEHWRCRAAKVLAARLQAVVVLKGNLSVVAGPDGRISFNSSGSPALATAGSGDCLTGVTAALLEGDGFASTVRAVFLHGLAGEIGGPGLMADDLPQLIRTALRQLTAGVF